MGYPAILWQSVGATLLGSFQFGYHLGVLNTALDQIAQDVGFDPTTSGAFVVSCLLLGAAAGSLTAGQLADRLGPKLALLVNNAPLIAGSVLCMLAPLGSQGLPSLYAGMRPLSHQPLQQEGQSSCVMLCVSRDRYTDVQPGHMHLRMWHGMCAHAATLLK